MKHVIRSFFACLLIVQGCVDQYPLEIPFGDPVPIVNILISTDSTKTDVWMGLSYKDGTDCFFITGLGNNTNCDFPTSDGFGAGWTIIKEEGGLELFNSNDPNPKRFSGAPGKTYFLDFQITYHNKTTKYHAETTMLKTPTIDSISYTVRSDIDKGDTATPLIWFDEPQNQRNYYLFNVCPWYGGSYSCLIGNSNIGDMWTRSVLSDEFLPSHVKGLSVSTGISPDGINSFIVIPGDGLSVAISSVSYETYKFYKALYEQFKNNGGAYSATPATPPGNIGNGAIGLFRAIDESSASLKYKF